MQVRHWDPFSSTSVRLFRLSSRAKRNDRAAEVASQRKQRAGPVVAEAEAEEHHYFVEGAGVVAEVEEHYCLAEGAGAVTMLVLRW